MNQSTTFKLPTSRVFLSTALSGLLMAGTASGAWAASFIGLSDLSGGRFSSIALGVSGDGSTVVGDSPSALGNEVFRWTRSTGMVGLGDIPGGRFSSNVKGVSGDGSTIVGTSGSRSGVEAFRWTSGTGMVGLGDWAGGPYNSHANGVSGDGSIIVGQGNSAAGAGSLSLDQRHRHG